MPWEYKANIVSPPPTLPLQRPGLTDHAQESFSQYHIVQEKQHDGSDDDSILDALGHAIAGAAGAAVSNSLVYPLTLAIARLQTQKKAAAPEKAAAGSSDSEPRYRNLADAIAKIARREGAPALYSGLTYDTAKTVADSFLFFLAYNFLSKWRRRHLGDHTGPMRVVDDIAIGIASGAFSKALTSPLSQIVTRKQTAAAARNADGTKKQEPSVVEIMQSIREKKGLQALWTGYSASLVMTLNPSITMLLDKVLTRLARLGDESGSVSTFLIAAISKSIATILMYPVGLAKTRAQAEASNADAKSSGGPGSILLALPKVAREQGLAALYTGVESEVLKGFLQHGLTMVVKERIHTVVIQVYLLLLGWLKPRRRDVITRP